jgi:hypothetical protein
MFKFISLIIRSLLVSILDQIIVVKNSLLRRCILFNLDEFECSKLCATNSAGDCWSAEWCNVLHCDPWHYLSSGISLPLTVPVSRLVGPTFIFSSSNNWHLTVFSTGLLFFLQNLTATVGSMAPEVQSSSLVSVWMVFFTCKIHFCIHVCDL